MWGGVGRCREEHSTGSITRDTKAVLPRAPPLTPPRLLARPTSPCISLHLPTPPYISLHLPTSPCISQARSVHVFGYSVGLGGDEGGPPGRGMPDHSQAALHTHSS